MTPDEEWQNWVDEMNSVDRWFKPLAGYFLVGYLIEVGRTMFHGVPLPQALWRFTGSTVYDFVFWFGPAAVALVVLIVIKLRRRRRRMHEELRPTD